MRRSIQGLMAVLLLSATTASQAWWGNNGWGDRWNPYDEWDPRYWMEEMEQAFDDDDWYGPGYYGGGPYGNPYGYGPRYYGGPAPYYGPRYAPPPPPAYGPRYGAPYGYPPARPPAPAPAPAPQQ